MAIISAYPSGSYGGTKPQAGPGRLPVLPTSDAPILAAAIKAEPDALITWNTKDFMRPTVNRAVRFSILTPGDFLKTFLEGDTTSI